jgi:hypothetical protein
VVIGVLQRPGMIMDVSLRLLYLVGHGGAAVTVAAG